LPGVLSSAPGVAPLLWQTSGLTGVSHFFDADKSLTAQQNPLGFTSSAITKYVWAELLEDSEEELSSLEDDSSEEELSSLEDDPSPHC